jgi:hypothetical protein
MASVMKSGSQQWARLSLAPKIMLTEEWGIAENGKELSHFISVLTKPD